MYSISSRHHAHPSQCTFHCTNCGKSVCRQSDPLHADSSKGAHLAIYCTCTHSRGKRFGHGLYSPVRSWNPSAVCEWPTGSELQNKIRYQTTTAVDSPCADARRHRLWLLMDEGLDHQMRTPSNKQPSLEVLSLFSLLGEKELIVLL